MIFSLVVAYDDNRGIGLNQDLPWRLPEDLKRFKKITLNKPIVMGRNTFESLPGMLPNRQHIVLSRDKDYRQKLNASHPDVITLESKEAFLKFCKENPKDEYCIIGGSIIWNSFLPLIDIMYVTHVKGSFEVDTYFPEWDKNDFQIISNEEHEKFIFTDYKRL